MNWEADPKPKPKPKPKPNHSPKPKPNPNWNDDELGGETPRSTQRAGKVCWYRIKGDVDPGIGLSLTPALT